VVRLVPAGEILVPVLRMARAVRPEHDVHFELPVDVRIELEGVGEHLVQDRSHLSRAPLIRHYCV
jgi:hypothetical protein